MKNIKIGVWLLIGLISSAVQAQNTNLMLWEENLEQLATEAESTDWEDELEELSHRLTQKLNLNTATRQQLEIFPFLSDIQVENLLAYVYIHGDMQTLYELQLVEEMDKATTAINANAAGFTATPLARTQNTRPCAHAAPKQLNKTAFRK